MNIENAPRHELNTPIAVSLRVEEYAFARSPLRCIDSCRPEHASHFARMQRERRADPAQAVSRGILETLVGIAPAPDHREDRARADIDGAARGRCELGDADPERESHLIPR